MQTNKLREALGKLRAELWNNTVISGKRKFELYEIADAALAAPATSEKSSVVGDAAKLREAVCALRTALKEIRNDVLDMVTNHKSEDPDSYAHGLCLSIGGACDMALNSTKEFEEGGNDGQMSD